VTDPDDLLGFWFGNSLADHADLPQHAKRWFGHDPRFDQTIAARFADDVQRAARGEYDRWTATAGSR
jgi:uncharacterized protein (DUF924 family)